MTALKVQIRRFVDGLQPGWVECALVDASGREHTFVEKAPVVTEAHLHKGSAYPQPGVIACTVLERRASDDGRGVIRVDTERPWGISSTEGQSQLEVLVEQLCEEHHP